MKTSLLVTALLVAAWTAGTLGCASAPEPAPEPELTAQTEAPAEKPEAKAADTKPEAKPKKSDDDDVFGGAVDLKDGGSAYAADPGAFKPAEEKKTTPAPVEDKPPIVVLGAPLIQGELEKTKVLANVKKKESAIKACFKERIQAKGPTGNMFVAFVVKPSGPVAGVKISKSSFADTKIDACVQKAFEGLVFPGRKGRDNISVTFPILLSLP